MYKDVQNILITLIDLFWVVFRIEKIRDKDNETGLKEGGGIEMSTTVLHSRAAPSLKYLPSLLCSCSSCC